MSTVNSKQGSRTSLTTSALNSLGSATYVSAGTLTFVSSSLIPLTCKLEVSVTSPSTVSGNKQVVVFAQASMDNSAYTTGPTSGTTTTDEPDLIPVGVVPCNTTSTVHTAMFDLAPAFGGTLPAYAKIIVKNETGSALPASTHSVYYTTYTADIA